MRKKPEIYVSINMSEYGINFSKLKKNQSQTFNFAGRPITILRTHAKGQIIVNILIDDLYEKNYFRK